MKRQPSIWKSILTGVFSFAIAATANAWPAKEKKVEFVPGEYVVQLKNKKSAYDAKMLEQRLQGRIKSQIRPDLIVVQRNVKDTPRTAVRYMKSLPFVKIAEPNYIFRVNRTPNDPEYSKTWGMSNTGLADSEGTVGVAGIDINAERAWDITTGSDDVIVSVVDTGVDFTHPDLMANAWTNMAEQNGRAGVDDDNNGFIDDIHGWNFANNNNNVNDDYGHGAHCAGTIGASGNNGIGVAGVAWNVKIMAVKFLDASGSGTLENAIKAIDYTTMMGVKISSNSWGGNINSDILKDSIKRAIDSGQLFIAAAGNESSDDDESPSMPAGFDLEGIVSVAAIDNRGQIAWFSNYGRTSVDLAAPGVNVYSTMQGNRYEHLSGTSMAAPHVSGVAALIKAANPNMTNLEIKERLLRTARPLAGLRGKTMTNGTVDAYYALTNQVAPADPNDPANWTTRYDVAVNSPHPYTDSFEATYTVTVPNAKRVSLHFSRFETEAGFDKVVFMDAAGNNLGTWSGNNNDRFSPIAEGDTITMKFTTDTSVTGYGFDIDFANYKTEDSLR